MSKLMLNIDKDKYKKSSSMSVMDLEYLNKQDRRMRFNNSKDPIYYVFEMLEKRSVVDLVGDLIEDSYFELTKMVSKVVK